MKGWLCGKCQAVYPPAGQKLCVFCMRRPDVVGADSAGTAQDRRTYVTAAVETFMERRG
jgi:hypothetical protein